MLTAVYRSVDRIARVCAVLAAALLSAAMLVTVTDIVLRLTARLSLSLLDRPLDLAVLGIVDLVELFVLGTAWLAIPYAFLSDSHVTVDLVTARLPARGGQAARAFGAVLSCIFLTLILWYCAQTAQQQIGYGDRSNTIAIPIVWYWAPLLAGAALSVIATALIAVREIAGVRRPPPRDPLEQAAA